MLLTALAAALALFAPQVVAATVAQGFDVQDQILTADLMRWMLITPVVFGFERDRDGYPELVPTFCAAGFGAGALQRRHYCGSRAPCPRDGRFTGWPRASSRGRSSTCWSRCPGWCAGACGIARRSDWTTRDVREVGRLMLPRTIGLAAVQINFLVNTVLASALPAGRIAALGYAWRVMLLPEGVVALSLATAVFPTFSEQNARREMDAFRQTFSTVFRTTLYLTIPAAVWTLRAGRPADCALVPARRV